MAASPAVGESILVAITLRLHTVQVGRWRQQRAELIAVAKSPVAVASFAGEVLAQDGEDKIIHWPALPLTLWKEWAESLWANVTSPAPQLFLAYRIEAGRLLPVLTAAGDEAAGYGEVDDTVLAAPLPGWLLEKVQAFVAAHYRPEKKKVRRRQ